MGDDAGPFQVGQHVGLPGLDPVGTILVVLAVVLVVFDPDIGSRPHAASFLPSRQSASDCATAKRGLLRTAASRAPTATRSHFPPRIVCMTSPPGRKGSSGFSLRARHTRPFPWETQIRRLTPWGPRRLLLVAGHRRHRDGEANPLEEISRTVAGQARRASSGLFDPESNQDAYHIGPGETVTLTTLAGPGEIRHMWFTIAGRDRRCPRTLVLASTGTAPKPPPSRRPSGISSRRATACGRKVESLHPGDLVRPRAATATGPCPSASPARIEVANEGGTGSLSTSSSTGWSCPLAAQRHALLPRPLPAGVPRQAILALRSLRGRGRGALRRHGVLHPVQLRELVRRIRRPLLHRRRSEPPSSAPAARTTSTTPGTSASSPTPTRE